MVHKRNGLRERSKSDTVHLTVCHSHPPGEDSRSGTSYGEPQASVEDRKGPLVSVGPNRLVTSLLSSARWCWFPRRLHTPTPGMPAGQRAGRSGQLGSPGPKLPSVFLTNLEPASPGFRVRAGHRPVASEPDYAKTEAVWIPPPGIRGGPLTGVSAEPPFAPPTQIDWNAIVINQL